MKFFNNQKKKYSIFVRYVKISFKKQNFVNKDMINNSIYILIKKNQKN